MLNRLARLRGGVAYDVASAVLGFVLACVMVATFRDYGLTYDEPNHVRYGEYVWAYFASGFEDERAFTVAHGYGAGFNVFAAFMRRVLPLDTWDATHFAVVTVGLLGYLGTWRLGRFVAGPAGGFWALLSLALTPVYYGHQFNNMKDAPFAAGYVWALYCTCRLVDALPIAGPRAWAAVGVSFGLAACTRIAGLVAFGILGLAILLHLVREGKRQGSAAGAGKLALGYTWRGALAVALAWLIIVLPWPWAHRDPIGNPLSSASSFASYAAYTSTTLLRGKKYEAQEAPWDYVPSYLIAQLAEWVTLAAAVAAVIFVWRGMERVVRGKPGSLAGMTVVVGAFLPPLLAIVKGSTVYDGLRHFLFIVPPVCVLGGAAIAWGLRWASQRSRVAGALASAALVLGYADQASAMIRLHPHQHVHFNRTVGGVGAAAGRYETEYYGNTYKELLAWLAQYTWDRDRQTYLDRVYAVTGCGSINFFQENLPANFKFIPRRMAGQADFFATYQRFDCHKHHGRYPVIHELERDGALLALVRDAKAAKPSTRKRKKGRRPEPEPEAAEEE